MSNSARAATSPTPAYFVISITLSSPTTLAYVSCNRQSISCVQSHNNNIGLYSINQLYSVNQWFVFNPSSGQSILVDILATPIPCNVPYCLTCSAANRCSSCTPSYVLNSNTNTCDGKLIDITSCFVADVFLKNKFAQNNKCDHRQVNPMTNVVVVSAVPCLVSQCQYCSSPNTCTVCNPGYSLVGNTCTSKERCRHASDSGLVIWCWL